MDFYKLYTAADLKIIEALNEEGLTQYQCINNALFSVLIFSKDLEDHQIEKLAHVICYVIQKKLIKEIVHQSLKQRDYFTAEEKKEIEKDFSQYQYVSSKEGYFYVTYYLIYMPILHLLKTDRRLNIEGFIKFRSQKYCRILEDLLEQFIEEYSLKKDIIRLFIMMKENSFLKMPDDDILHVIYDKNGQGRIYNHLMKDMTQEYARRYCSEFLSDTTLNNEDLLMHIMLSRCPRKIVVHAKERAKQPRFIKTLELTFGNIIEYCKECEYCKRGD